MKQSNFGSKTELIKPLVKHADPGIDYAGPKENNRFDEMHDPELLKQMNIKTIDECIPNEILKGKRNGS